MAGSHASFPSKSAATRSGSTFESSAYDTNAGRLFIRLACFEDTELCGEAPGDVGTGWGCATATCSGNIDGTGVEGSSGAVCLVNYGYRTGVTLGTREITIKDNVTDNEVLSLLSTCRVAHENGWRENFFFINDAEGGLGGGALFHLWSMFSS